MKKEVKENMVIINNHFDLYNLSYSDIKKTKLYNFAGDYFNEIYKEALELEKSNTNVKDIPLSLYGLLINFVELEMEYKTEVLILFLNVFIRKVWTVHKDIRFLA